MQEQGTGHDPSFFLFVPRFPERTTVNHAPTTGLLTTLCHPATPALMMLSLDVYLVCFTPTSAHVHDIDG